MLTSVIYIYELFLFSKLTILHFKKFVLSAKPANPKVSCIKRWIFKDFLYLLIYVFGRSPFQVIENFPKD